MASTMLTGERQLSWPVAVWQHDNSRVLVLGEFRGPAPIARYVELQDRRVMHTPIDGCHGHGRLGEYLVPLDGWLAFRAMLLSS